MKSYEVLKRRYGIQKGPYSALIKASFRGEVEILQTSTEVELVLLSISQSTFQSTKLADYLTTGHNTSYVS